MEILGEASRERGSYLAIFKVRPYAFDGFCHVELRACKGRDFVVCVSVLLILAWCWPIGDACLRWSFFVPDNFCHDLPLLWLAISSSPWTSDMVFEVDERMLHHVGDE